MKTFELEDYCFHYINDMGITVLCMADKLFNRKTCFAFLQDCKKALLAYYTSDDIQKAGPMGLEAFKETMSDKLVSIIFH